MSDVDIIIENNDEHRAEISEGTGQTVLDMPVQFQFTVKNNRTNRINQICFTKTSDRHSATSKQTANRSGNPTVNEAILNQIKLANFAPNNSARRPNSSHYRTTTNVNQANQVLSQGCLSQHRGQSQNQPTHPQTARENGAVASRKVRPLTAVTFKGRKAMPVETGGD
jgi:hypothetical protein